MSIEADIGALHSRVRVLEELVAALMTDAQAAKLDDSNLISTVISQRTGYDVYVRRNHPSGYVAHRRYSGDPPPAEVLPFLETLRSHGMDIKASAATE